MIAVILAVVLIIAAAAVAIVVLASVGARREPRGSLPAQAPAPLAGLARRILGLHVRRPCADIPAPGRTTDVRRRPEVKLT